MIITFQVKIIQKHKNTLKLFNCYNFILKKIGLYVKILMNVKKDIHTY